MAVVPIVVPGTTGMVPQNPPAMIRVADDSHTVTGVRTVRTDVVVRMAQAVPVLMMVITGECWPREPEQGRGTDYHRQSS